MKTTFEAARERADLETVAAQYTKLSRSKLGPCPLCGGTDRFYIHKGGHRWGCRKCERQGDVIDLVAAVEKVSLREAAGMLAGAAFETSKPMIRPQRTEKVPEWPKPEWQWSATAEILAGLSRIVPWQGGGEYLQSRGIAPLTWVEFCIGEAMVEDREKNRRPALVIPWLDAARRCSAIKYRFLDELGQKDKNRRFHAKWGGSQTIFGAHLVDPAAQTLVIVEGELNCISIWQATRGKGVDVLSLGSQDGDLSRRILKRRVESRAYAQVLTWLDQPGKAAAAAAPLGAVAMQSPNGRDANDILRSEGPDYLAQLIDAVIVRGAK